MAWLLVLGAVWFPYPSPAPFIYRPGEGWIYEPVGSEGKWMRGRAEDQLNVARESFAAKKFKTTCRACRRLLNVWPLSDYAAEAQFLLGRAYEERGYDERAFKAYQTLLARHPKSESFNQALERQYAIAGRFFNGQWFKLWNTIPLSPSIEKTAALYSQIISNGIFSPVAPLAQMQIGAAREKKKLYPEAVRAYSVAADRYYDRPEIAADALYKEGAALQKQAKTAEYDQSIAGEAIDTFTDFIALFPDDKRVPEAQAVIDSMRTEQARGSFEIARYYEKRRRVQAALIYYNEVIVKDPNSGFAQEAKDRISYIKGDAEPKPPAEKPN
jgi:outer membrane protein assembly factor BamD